MRKFLALSGALALAGLLAGSVFALTIRGSAGADTLRGTSNADTIYGYAGNDKLYGLGGNDKLYGGAGNDLLVGGPGNDTLVGGPGADVIKCGSGRDTVITDGADTIASDCEVVKGPPASKPTPTPAPSPSVIAGNYSGTTTQNETITFTVVGMQVTNVFVNAVNRSCQPPNIVSASGALRVVSVNIGSGGSFSGTFSQISPTLYGPMTSTVTFAGTIGALGTATGSIKVNDSLETIYGTVTCTAPSVTWTAIHV